MGTLVLGALMSMVGRVITAQGVEWLVRWGADWLVKCTATTHDDEFLAGVERLLDGQKP